METTPSSLPEMKKSEEKDPDFEESKSEARSEKVRTIWIIILAFMLLASLGVIVWLVLSGRTDQRIHGDNLSAFTDNKEPDSSQNKKDNIDPGTVVNDREINLTDYDSNIIITEGEEHILSGILNYSVLVNAEVPVTLTLNGVTISSSETSAIANQSEKPLTIILAEGTTNTLTDGGESVYDGAIFSNGPLTIRALGSDNAIGSLIVSGRQKDGEGIATKNADLIIESGKIMVTSNDDGLNAGGDSGGTISVEGGVLWIKAEGDGIDSNGDIKINGGNLLIMSTSKDNSSLDSEAGIFINGGNVVALGSGMPEAPSGSSAQKSLSIELNETVPNGATVYIKNTTTGKIVNFKTESSFSTLVFSMPSTEVGDYELSIDGRVIGTGIVK